jgi:putative addiction module component (TIGR02574 family)
MSKANLPPDILALPMSERIELATKIWDSIEEDDLIDAQHLQVFEARLAEYRANPKLGIEWEELNANLRRPNCVKSTGRF